MQSRGTFIGEPANQLTQALSRFRSRTILSQALQRKAFEHALIGKIANEKSMNRFHQSFSPLTE